MIRPDRYKLYLEGKKFTVAADHHPLLRAVDARHDGIIHNDEIADFLRKRDILPDPAHNPGDRHIAVDRQKIIADFKRNLLRLPTRSQKKLYPDYAEYIEQMRDLQRRYPRQAALVSLGEIEPGTSMFALRVTANAGEDSSAKPGILFTGLTHAREWQTGRVTLQTAENLLAGFGKDQAITRQLEGAEIWFIPVMNPKGYDYSLTTDSFWRKNCHEIYQDETGCKQPGQPHEKVALGVDINRNFCGKDKQLWRVAGDSPCSTQDDYGASDDPEAEDYRGPSGASEKEVQLIQSFIFAHPNLKGVIDHHSYGNMILYPWGSKKDKVENVEDYLAAAKSLNEAGDGKFKIMQSIKLYPTTGDSTDFGHDNGLFNFCLEIGTAFHSTEDELKTLLKRIPKMDSAFIDWILAHKAA